MVGVDGSDTRHQVPPPLDALRSSDASLIGTDRLSEQKMLMTDNVSEMLRAQADIIRGFGGGVGLAFWKKDWLSEIPDLSGYECYMNVNKEKQCDMRRKDNRQRNLLSICQRNTRLLARQEFQIDCNTYQ